MTEKKEIFLNEIRKGKGVSSAAFAAKIHLSTFYYWLKDDKIFERNYESTLIYISKITDKIRRKKQNVNVGIQLGYKNQAYYEDEKQYYRFK